MKSHIYSDPEFKQMSVFQTLIKSHKLEIGTHQFLGFYLPFLKTAFVYAWVSYYARILTLWIKEQKDSESDHLGVTPASLFLLLSPYSSLCSGWDLRFYQVLWGVLIGQSQSSQSHPLATMIG